MYQYPQYHNFDLDPRISVSGFHDAVAEGEEALLRALRRQMAEGGKRICMELYPGVDEAKILGMLSQLDDTTILRSEDARLSQEALREQFAEAITDDRVFGIMSCALLRDCFDPVELRELSAKVDAAEGPVIVVGVGASLAMPGAGLPVVLGCNPLGDSTSLSPRRGHLDGWRPRRPAAHEV